MRRYLLPLLLGLNAAVMGWLVWLWLLPSGEWRDVHWTPPAARKADFGAMVPTLPSPAAPSTGQVLSVLERPLFSGTRRPPPPPAPPVAEAPVDNMSTARLTGLFQGSGTGSIILNIAGKDRRARLNEVIEGWTLKSIEARNVTFVRGNESRVLPLARASLKNYTGAARPAGIEPSMPAGQLARPPALQPSAGATLSNNSPAPQAPPAFTVGGGRR